MRSFGLAQAKAQLSALLDAVESGDEVVITRRGQPVARLVRELREERESPPVRGCIWTVAFCCRCSWPTAAMAPPSGGYAARERQRSWSATGYAESNPLASTHDQHTHATGAVAATAGSAPHA